MGSNRDLADGRILGQDRCGTKQQRIINKSVLKAIWNLLCDIHSLPTEHSSALSSEIGQGMSGGFEALGLMPELLHSISELDWALPTSVQDEAIPLILGGGDVMAASETGSGKTAAFCLPIIQCVYERLRETEQKTTDEVLGSCNVRLSSIQRSIELIISPDEGLDCKSPPGVNKWIGVRATHGVKSGKYYYEVTSQGNGTYRVGWSTTSAHLELGKDAYGFGYGGSGFKSTNNVYAEYGGKFAGTDVIGCYLDWEEKTISYSKNGKYLGVAFNITKALEGSVLFPAIVIQGGEASVNFGSGNVPFKSFVNPPRKNEVLEGDSESGSNTELSVMGAVSDITDSAYLSLNSAHAQNLISESSKEAFTITGKRLPLAIIVEPVKELAEQVGIISKILKLIQSSTT